MTPEEESARAVEQTLCNHPSWVRKDDTRWAYVCDVCGIDEPNHAVAIGVNATASGHTSVAIGRNAFATSQYMGIPPVEGEDTDP